MTTWYHSLYTALQNMTCGITLNIGSIICSCVSTQKGTILKVIVVDFLNLLNRKSYRHSLVFFFVSDLTWERSLIPGFDVCNKCYNILNCRGHNEMMASYCWRRDWWWSETYCPAEVIKWCTAKNEPPGRKYRQKFCRIETVLFCKWLQRGNRAALMHLILIPWNFHCERHLVCGHYMAETISLLLWRTRTYPMLVHVGFLVDRVALGHLFS